MKFKVGDRVKVIKCETMKERCPHLGKVGTIVEVKGMYPYLLDIDENERWCDDELELVQAKFTGIELLQKVKNGIIKNADVKVYKENKYQFEIKIGEKSILDNPQHHIGMLTSDKYTYEPIIKREMTISQIEKELGYSIKIVKEN